MFNDEMTKQMMDIFGNPLFKKGFFDFFLKMQQEGIEAARKFWTANSNKNLFPDAMDMYERIADFYIMLGFVPRTKYDEVLNENKSLKEENKFLRDTIRELQVSLFSEGGEKVRQIWHSSIDKQMEMNKEVSRNFLELFRQMKSSTS